MLLGTAKTFRLRHINNEHLGKIYTRCMLKLTHTIKAYPTLTIVILVIMANGILSALGQEHLVRVLLSGFLIFIALKLAVGMVQTLREGRYGIDILAVMAIFSTVYVGEYWAAIVIVLMLTGGEALEDYAANRAQRELNALLERAPQTAHKITKSGTKTVRLSEIRIKDRLLVRPGEVVPVDAILIDKSAEFDESSLTGESLPVEHTAGDELLSGSINGSSAITIEATRSAEDSQYQQIIKLVKDAASSEAPFVRLADRYAIPFTIISFAIAGIAWAASGEFMRFAQVLVVATPCPLLLGAPIALISGMSRAAKNGVIIKNGGILERLATIRTVAFDKTGTLTHGEPEVSKLLPANGFSEHDLVLYSASAEQQSVHVLAQALIAKARSENISLQKPKKVSETTAQGVSAMVAKKTVLVGKASYLKEAGVSIDKKQLQAGEMAVHVAINGVYAGSVVFSDRVREESKKTIKLLEKLGVRETLMLTGDGEATANRIAREVGITNIKAECLPIDKVNAVKECKTRPVMMVGDGVNDAPVLAVAEVGMAMGARGSTAASETADVVVLVDDITKSAEAVKIAKYTMFIASQSIWIGISISVVLMLIAATGVIPAVVGAGLQEVVDVVVIFNALRAHGPWGKA